MESAHVLEAKDAKTDVVQLTLRHGGSWYVFGVCTAHSLHRTVQLPDFVFSRAWQDSDARCLSSAFIQRWMVPLRCEH